MRRVYGHKLSNIYEAQHSSKRRALREADAAEFVVLIAMKGPDGKTYDSIGYADEDTDIDYQNGIYGYDNDIRKNVHAMTRADATKLCADIVENAPAGDVIVGVVPYSTIPAEGGSAEDVEPSEDDMEIPGSEDADTDEGSDDEDEEESLEDEDEEESLEDEDSEDEGEGDEEDNE